MLIYSSKLRFLPFPFYQPRLKIGVSGQELNRTLHYMKMFFRRLPLLIILNIFIIACGGGSNSATVFEIKIENISSANQFSTSLGTPLAMIFSGAVWAVHDGENPLFSYGLSAASSVGIESFAEDGDPYLLSEELIQKDGIFLTGANDLNNLNQRWLPPTTNFIFQIAAKRGTRFSAALAFLQGNDIFVANQDPIPLFDPSGTAVERDITASFLLLDAGTEINQEPGLGTEQVIRQPAPNTGAAENSIIQVVADGYSYLPIEGMLRISVRPIREVEY